MNIELINISKKTDFTIEMTPKNSIFLNHSKQAGDKDERTIRNFGSCNVRTS